MKSWKYRLKLQIIGSAALIYLVQLSSPAKAFNESQVRQLLQTKECSRCDLSGANLSGADLSLAILTDANLSGANLQNANLSQADLSRANLSNANLSQSNLNRAYLINANLDGTNLSAASMQGTRGVPIVAIPNLSPPRLPPFRSSLRVPPLPSARLPNLPAAPPIQPLRLPNLRLPTATPVRLTPSTGIRRSPSLQIPTIPPSPAQNLSLLPPPIVEVHRYFLNSWKSPTNLTTSLVYTLVINNDGSIKQVIPYGKVDETYLDRTGIPLLGQRFISPFPEGQTNRIRLILMPGNRVFTFPEP